MLKLNLFNSNITNYKQLTHNSEKSCHEEPVSTPADFQNSGMASKNYASVVLTKPSNTLGFGTEHNIKLPVEEASKILEESLTKIYASTSAQEKVEHCLNAFQSIDKNIKDFYNLKKSGLSKEKGYMIGSDLSHEVKAKYYESLLNKYIYPFDIQEIGINEEIMSPKFNHDCKEIFASMLEPYNRFQFFIDKGLAEKGKTPLSGIFDMAVSSIQKKAQANNTEIKIKGHELLKSPEIEPLKQDYKTYTAFFNLLDNAVKYSNVPNSSEKGIVKVEFVRDTKQKNFLNISVSDNGIGIPEEDKAKVLLGRRAENAVKSGILGTGHGLNRIEKIFNLKSENIISPLNPASTDRKGTKITCPIAEIPLIKLPIKEMQDLTNQHLQEIISAKNPDEKVHICKKALKNIEEKYDNYYDFVKKSITEDEQNMLEGDFHHEFMGKICDLIDEHINYFELKNDPNPRSRNRHKPLPPDLDKICAKTFTGITDAFKRYQSFLDKGLAGIRNVPVPEIFNLALDSVKDLSASNNVEIQIKGQGLLNKTGFDPLTTDYNLYAVFSNLIQNAVKYSNVKDSSEKGKVLIEFSKDRDKKDIINLSVTDNGIGISPENHESVKEGERAGNAIESGVSGTGYGLKRIAKILRYMDCKNDGLIITSPLNSNSVDRKGTKITCPISRIPENPQ